MLLLWLLLFEFAYTWFAVVLCYLRDANELNSKVLKENVPV
jgi:hypothetical protein